MGSHTTALQRMWARLRSPRADRVVFKLTPKVVADLVAAIPHKRPIVLTVCGGHAGWAIGQQLAAGLRTRGFEVYAESWPESRFAEDGKSALQWQDQFREIAVFFDPRRKG